MELLGSDEETNLRTKLLPCYLQLLGAGAGERYCGNESAEGAVTMLFELLSCWGAAAGERDCADESADGAVAMLFAAVGAQLLGCAIRCCGRCCVRMLLRDTLLRTLLLDGLGCC